MKKKSISLLLTILLLSFFAITNAFCLTFYVDISTGKDNPAQGVKPEKPWKTITYALQQTSVIEQYEDVLINVAAGAYNENITIDKRSVSIVGTGLDTIIDGVGLDVITIDGVQKVAIRGFTIQNGNKGIYGKRGSAIEVSDTTVQDCSNNGIQVDENSTLHISDCIVQRIGRDGIGVYISSSATFSGTIDSNNNTGAGIKVGFTSSAFFNDAIVNTNLNGGSGIQLFENSSASFYGTTASTNIMNNEGDGINVSESSNLKMGRDCSLNISGNKKRGIGVRGSSNASFYGNSYVNNNGWFGIAVSDNSGAVLDGIMEIQKNIESGLKVTRASAFNVWSKGNLTISQTSGDYYSFGIEVRENSLFSVEGGLSVSETSVNYPSGIVGGIRVHSNSHVEMNRGGLEVDFQIHNNNGVGVRIDHSSSGRFFLGTKIKENTADGIMITGNSQFAGWDIETKNNGTNGFYATDGSSVFISSSNITGHSVDVDLSFGARSKISKSTIGTLACDETVLSAGQQVCP